MLVDLDDFDDPGHGYRYDADRREVVERVKRPASFFRPAGFGAPTRLGRLGHLPWTRPVFVAIFAEGGVLRVDVGARSFAWDEGPLAATCGGRLFRWFRISRGGRVEFEVRYFDSGPGDSDLLRWITRVVMDPERRAGATGRWMAMAGGKEGALLADGAPRTFDL